MSSPTPNTTSSSGAHRLVIQGIEVIFPFEPYRVQVSYMSAVITALNERIAGRRNAALESPTGTGKTLCLLCATCAWLVHMRARMKSDPASLPTTAKHLRILYTTRTHSQVTQVMSEFKRTAYAKEILACVLGSREHMCANPRINALRGHALNAQCNALRSQRQCKFHNKLAVAPQPSPTRILDIEDLMKDGTSNGYCPYFYTRDTMLPVADIIFAPYNYALDPSVVSNELNLDECVLVVDEAHNLPSVCLGVTSVDVSTADIEAAVADTARAIDAVQHGVGLDDMEGPQDPAKTEGMVRELGVLKKVWCNLERGLDTLPLEHHQDTGLKVFLRRGEHVYEFLAQHNINAKTAKLLMDKIENSIELVVAAAEKAGYDPTCRGLQSMASFLRYLFPKNIEAEKQFAELTQSYYFVVQEQRQQQGDNRRYALSTSREHRLLSLWCCDASVCMRRVGEKAFGVIVTSGTLSPIESFTAELGLVFPVVLQGPHVISAAQVTASVCCASPTGVPLNSSFQNRNNSDYKIGIAQSIVNLSRTVPDGFLVFFSSYSLMNSVLELWQSKLHEGLWNDLKKIKTPFTEPRSTAELRDVVRQFQACVDSGRGAILFAVCRGKISEGIDFADRHGRCVAVVGVPYASRGDLLVYLRRKHIDAGPQRTATFNGDVWYRQDAIRSVNQALGRVIRHKDDFGAVVLMDHRYAQHTKEISRWLQPYLTVSEGFAGVGQALASFFMSWKGQWAPTAPQRSGRPEATAAVVPHSASAALRFAEKTKMEAQNAMDRRRFGIDTMGTTSASPPQPGNVMDRPLFPSVSTPMIPKTTITAIPSICSSGGGGGTSASYFVSGSHSAASATLSLPVATPSSAPSSELAAFLDDVRNLLGRRSERYATFKAALSLLKEGRGHIEDACCDLRGIFCSAPSFVERIDRLTKRRYHASLFPVEESPPNVVKEEDGAEMKGAKSQAISTGTPMMVTMNQSSTKKRFRDDCSP
eukprot:PhM_4_TR6351/c0_g1_i2/m.37461/K11136/RTEL1; regulator of telomere elongation helicase 1